LRTQHPLVGLNSITCSQLCDKSLSQINKNLSLHYRKASSVGIRYTNKQIF